MKTSRTALGTVVGISLLATTARAATISWPPAGKPRFQVDVPQGWRSRVVGGAERRIEITSPRDGATIAAWALPTSDASRLDDVVARGVDARFKKAEFSNLHQRRQLNGVEVISFRGSAHDRARGRVIHFEFYCFPLETGETGVLRIEVPSGAAPTTIEAARAAAESLTVGSH